MENAYKKDKNFISNEQLYPDFYSW